MLFILLGLMSCQDDDLTLDTILAPTNLTISSEISDDGSGLVDFQAMANNAITYKYTFSDGSSGVAPAGNYTKRFTRTGLNTYLVTVVAYGKGGVSSSKTIEVEVQSDFDDPETKNLLTGGISGSSKTWYIASALPGHLAVGPSAVPEPGASFEDFDTSYFSAAPDFGPDCFYEDKMIFGLDDDGNIFYNYNNKNSEDVGVSFFNWQYTAAFGGSGAQYSDECLEYQDPDAVSVSLVPASSGVEEVNSDLSTGTAMELGDDEFISYYIGNSTYEILEITEDYMYLRTIQGNDPTLAWYIKLTTDPDGGGTDVEEPDFESQYNDLLWADEFDGDALDTDNWNYETGNGTNGWGNNELQFYTQDNVKVQDGNLVITAKKESESGFNYTSGRITTKDNIEFTYGRVEVRAKMPEGAGTWPAIWLLGADFDEVGWPETGEIDIMEYVGSNPQRVQSALHYPDHSGGSAEVGDTAISNAASEFHTYTAEWTADTITFLLDGEVYFTFDNDESKPFNKDFFLILNLAMGGNLGGNVDPDFQESALIIDYVHIYQ